MKKENGVKISNLFLILTLFLFVGLIIRVSYIAMSPTVDNINIQELASKRTTKTTILKANQRNYIVSIYKQLFHCIQLVVQIVLLYFTHDYILYLIIQFVCTFLRNFSISRKASKMYPYLHDKEESNINKEERKERKHAVCAHAEV